MSHALSALLVLLAASLSAAAQETAPAETPAQVFNRSFQEGLAAHAAGDYETFLAAFQRCLEVVPNNPAATYNVACGHALLGHEDAGLEWLSRAVDAGFGPSDSDFGLLQQDSDLNALRDDPRFDGIVSRVSVQRIITGDYEARPAAVHVPAALAGRASLPLLVVLHDAGQTAQSIVTGPWARIADELGAALVAPSARFALDGDDRGPSWFAELGAYARSHWSYERPIDDAIRAFQAEQELDAGRVIIVGEGQGGVVAFNAAMAKPELFKAVVALDADVQPDLAASRAAHAARMGLKVRILTHAPDEAVIGRLRGWGLDGTLRVLSDENAHSALLETLRTLVPSEAPASDAGE